MTDVVIYAEFDREAEVWVAASPDFPGIMVHSETKEGAIQELEELIFILSQETQV